MELLAQQQPRLYYDDQCWLCRFFASQIHKKSQGVIGIVPLSEIDFNLAPENINRDIIYFDGKDLLQGQVAWRELLRKIPAFGSLTWIATRLGWENAVVSTFMHSAHRMRRLCVRCPK